MRPLCSLQQDYRGRCSRRPLQGRAVQRTLILGCEFLSYPSHIIVAGEVPAVGRGDAFLDLADLPSIQGDIVLDGLGGQPIARAVGFLGEPVKRVRRLLFEATVKAAGN